MQKTLLLLSILFFSAVGAFAQSNSAAPALGVGVSYGVPQAPNSSSTPYAGGLIFRLQSPVTSRLSLIFKTGYTFYAAGDVTLGSYNDNPYLETPATGTIWSFVPVEAGAKFFFIEKWYIEADGGVSFFLNYHPGGNKSVAPIVTPGLGYDIHFGPSKNYLDLGCNYENRINYSSAISDFSQISFHAILNFGL